MILRPKRKSFRGTIGGMEKVWERVACRDCGANHLSQTTELDPCCFDCRMARMGGPKYSVYASIDAGGEDSTDPRRVRDGTASINAGLPGVETIVGTRPDGKPKTSYRPVTNAELGTSRGIREYAKRHNLEPVVTQRRAIGGR